MAFVDTVDTDNEPMDVAQPEAPPVHLDLPDWANCEATSDFLVQLDRLGDVRGVKTLKKYTTKYLDATRIAEHHLQQVMTSVNTVNGVASPRTGTPGMSNELRKFKRASRTYFSGLNTPELRQQCAVFGLHYDGYETVDEVVAALVDANVAKRNME
jgi:hypothetical protein